MDDVKKSPAREERIVMEIVVDAYGETERAMGWYCYLEDSLAFPFEAECVARRQTSPLRPGQRVTVIGMPDSIECPHDMFVLVEWDAEDGDGDGDDDDELAVPLSQLKPLKTNAETRRAAGDWHFWVARGYQF